MILPSLWLQALYGQLGWAVVMAAVMAGLMSIRGMASRRTLKQVVLLSLILSLLPGDGSPTHWLRLVFQLPSALLVMVCVLSLWARWRGECGFCAVPGWFANAIAVIGALLYLDSSAWLSFDLYARGFGSLAGLIGVLLAVAAVVAIARHVRRPAAVGALIALMLFAVLRLPTGNLWDTLLDPMLWIWALLNLAGRALALREHLSDWRGARTADATACQPVAGHEDLLAAQTFRASPANESFPSPPALPAASDPRP